MRETPSPAVPRRMRRRSHNNRPADDLVDVLDPLVEARMRSETSLGDRSAFLHASPPTAPMGRGVGVSSTRTAPVTLQTPSEATLGLGRFRAGMFGWFVCVQRPTTTGDALDLAALPIFGGRSQPVSKLSSPPLTCSRDAGLIFWSLIVLIRGLGIVSFIANLHTYTHTPSHVCWSTRNNIKCRT
ncbi:hypothetical protein CIHG_07868 [Coccidioides immitis H538.4]|uniref:Uncharacterized protein n=1 Tax=Coccidioides immitis H538.4 TaxID=396776 RepID=A0A0J8RXG6_COCIT|nr:hypothetical protein CIHG_07868 [Coccidioides immitis H538.4]